MPHVAVYWDFENIHASLCARQYGPDWYRENIFSKQPRLVDVNSIMQYIAELGNVNINRAYANWSFLHAYSYELQNFAVDLIQMFPRGKHGKNGADIRMSIDIVEDISVNPHIETVVLIGGDSDYIAVAQKVRQRGKNIVGIGVQETTNQYWVKSCTEFKYYAALLVKSSQIEDVEAAGFEVGDIDAAKALLRKAVEAGIAGFGHSHMLKAAVKPMMQRFDPSFDEGNYGFKSFTDFLGQCGDIVEISHGAHDHLVRPRAAAVPARKSAPPHHDLHRYDAILRRQDIRLIEPALMTSALEHTYAILSANEINTLDLKLLLAEAMHASGREFADGDAGKLRSLLYKAMALRYLDGNKTTLVPEIGSSADLLHRVRFMLFKRVLDNVPDEELDVAHLSRMLYGDDAHIDDIHQLAAQYHRAA